MTFLGTPERSPLYQPELARLGYVPNYVRLFALQPDAYAAWQALGAAVRKGMDPLRYELVTLVTARRLGTRYCALAHAAVLLDQHLDDAALEAVLTDRKRSGLPAAELAVLDFAEKIAADPGAGTAADTDRLRAHGLSDVDIFQVVLAVAIRRFFAGVLDATGARPDAAYDSLGPRLLAAL